MAPPLTLSLLSSSPSERAHAIACAPNASLISRPAAEGRVWRGQAVDRGSRHMAVGRELGILEPDAAPGETIRRERLRLHQGDFTRQEATGLRRECALEAL